MKTCSRCGRLLPFSHYYKNYKTRDGFLTFCKDCVREKYGPGRTERAKAAREALQRIKVERGCTDCGYAAHAAALDFDHLPGTRKLFRPSTLPGVSVATLEAELAKCEVVCANCHRIRTANRRQTT